MAFPGTYNFNYYRGDRFDFVIYPKNSDGSAFDLADYATPEKSAFTIATARGAGAIQYIGAAEVDLLTNTITCTILPTVGRNLSAANTYYYDVQINNGSTVIYTLLTGSITIQDDITGGAV
jgi:hypothetical protein